MVVKNQIKFIKSLQQKKYRNQHGLFVVEGLKLVQELLNSHFKVYGVYTTRTDILENIVPDVVHLITESELKRMSGLQSPNGILGVFYIPEPTRPSFSDWIVALDDVRDPGNLGTIIRLCDWFGVQHLVCSKQTVDCYNSKVLQATMGSITRVHMLYTDLETFIQEAPVPAYGTFLDGDSIYANKLPEKGILLLGNEGKGISSTLKTLMDHKITIPQYGKKTTESLNVAMAAAILLGEVRRT